VSSGYQNKAHADLAQSFTPAGTGILQRKCTLCNTPGLVGDLKRDNEERPLRRSHVDRAEPSAVPSIVHEVLRSPGQPLEPETRAFMESRFGHDFSRVRVQAAELPIQAKLTIGQPNDRYEQEADRVADAVMQIPESQSVENIDISKPNQNVNIQRMYPDPHDPHVNPNLVGKINGLRYRVHTLPQSFRTFFEPRFGHDFSEVRLHTDAQAAESARAVNALAYTLGQDIFFGAGQYAPKMQSGKRLIAHELTHVIQQSQTVATGANFLQRVVNHARQNLNEEERARLEEIPSVPAQPALPADTTSAFSEGPYFVLHDTATALPIEEMGMGGRFEERIEEHRDVGRGPLAETGTAVFVRRVGPMVPVRQAFFESRRPTSSRFEQGEDIIRERSERESRYRNVWRVTRDEVRQSALSEALDGLGLTPEEIETERSVAEDQLSRISGNVTSTAIWTIDVICDRVRDSGAESVATPDNAAVLIAACENLSSLLEAREARISSSFNVEIAQIAGSNCSTTGRLIPLLNPPYTEEQYWNLAGLYLHIALNIGRFPEITTHYLLDKSHRLRCDPRCFNLDHLYYCIQSLIGADIHPPTPDRHIYGIQPIYGTGWYNNANVWWHNEVCHGEPPRP
jgi:hypothetical protein